MSGQVPAGRGLNQLLGRNYKYLRLEWNHELAMLRVHRPRIRPARRCSVTSVALDTELVPEVAQ